MAERYGTDLTALGGYEGGVNSENGAALISTSSDGETALLFGPAALREIQAGVANGDFAIAPDDSTGTITAENPLPYWTFTDVNSAGAITCAIVPDTGVGSGNLLKFSVASGTLTGKSATLTRFIPVASSASRTFSYYLEASFLNGTAGTAGTKATVQVSGQFYEQDQTTTTGSAFVSAATKFSDLTGATAKGILAPDFYSIVAPSFANMTAPADAAFLKITVTVATTATQTATNEISLTEVRAARGAPELLLTDRIDPVNYSPAIIYAEEGTLSLDSGDGASLALAEDLTDLVAENIYISAGDNLTLDGFGSVDIYGNTAITGTLAADSFSINAGVGIIGTNGSFTGFNATLSGGQGLRHDEPGTTTQTSSAAIWVTVSGTLRQLRRNSSSARYKTNIVDADEVVLEAARKVKPRHYESTIEDENGATRLGFIAEEIHDAGLTHAVGYDEEGRPETIDPVALIAALWHRVSDLEDRLKALEAE